MPSCGRSITTAGCCQGPETTWLGDTLPSKTGPYRVRRIGLDGSVLEQVPRAQFLVPWIFDYYTKLGFSPAHNIHKIHALRRVSASSALSSLF